MNKAELLADLATRVTRVMEPQLQAQDTVKIAAGISPYLVPSPPPPNATQSEDF